MRLWVKNEQLKNKRERKIRSLKYLWTDMVGTDDTERVREVATSTAPGSNQPPALPAYMSKGSMARTG